jgi:partner of Y14 and mago protein
MDNLPVNERGEKVLTGSRRPDGTVRKERRIRAGYTPQDEQPSYVSAGAMVSTRLVVGSCSAGATK